MRTITFGDDVCGANKVAATAFATAQAIASAQAREILITPEATRLGCFSHTFLRRKKKKHKQRF